MSKFLIFFSNEISFSYIFSYCLVFISNLLFRMLKISIIFFSLKIIILCVSIVPFFSLLISKIFFWNKRIIKLITFHGSMLVLFITIIICIQLDKFFYYKPTNFNCKGLFFNDIFTFSFHFDGLTAIFLLLTNIIMPVCLIICWIVKRDLILLLFLVSMLQIFLNFLFMASDLTWFYFFYECTLLPILLLIINWGSNVRRQKACILFGIYSIVSSIFLFIGILFVIFQFGSSNYFFLLQAAADLVDSENNENCINNDFSLVYYLNFCLFISFAVKIPTVPFLAWLPEAHVEAPTVGSIILAALLLKIGGYGLLRWVILFNSTIIFIESFLIPLFSISALLGSFYIVTQVDFKRIIAYSSIVHINLFSLSLILSRVEIGREKGNYDGLALIFNPLEWYGLISAVFGYFSHGIISASLFAIVGMLYSRFNTRLILYYEGLVLLMPIFSVFFFIFILSNNGFPLTSGFYAELIMFIALVFSEKYYVIMIVIISIFFSLYAGLILIQKLLFGNLRANNGFKTYVDLNEIEFSVLVFLLGMNVWLGFSPFFLNQLLIIYANYSIEGVFDEPAHFGGPTTRVRVSNAYYSSDSFNKDCLNDNLIKANPGIVVTEFIYEQKKFITENENEDPELAQEHIVKQIKLIQDFSTQATAYFESPARTKAASDEDNKRIERYLKTRY